MQDQAKFRTNVFPCTRDIYRFVDRHPRRFILVYMMQQYAAMKDVSWIKADSDSCPNRPLVRVPS